jgi:mannose-6-phosphate isomerase-like protein (cupin superfamily)
MRLESESFVVAEWRDEGTTRRDFPVAPLHVHRADDEAWYVLEGRLGFRIGDEEREVGAGDGIVVPRGTPHSFWNATAVTTRYLVVMTPKIAELIEALHDGGDLRELFQRYDSELL